jgi:hypothetical protein
MDWIKALLFFAALACAACQNTQPADSGKSGGTMTKEAEATDLGPVSEKYTLPGYVVYEEEGRLWVFREGSDALKDYRAKGEPAKRVTLVGAGPNRMTIMGAERETLEAYCAPWKYGCEGFVVIGDDGRLWVFREGSQALADFRAKGEPAKRVTLIGAGPDRKTIMGADRGTLEAYLQAGNPQ